MRLGQCPSIWSFFFEGIPKGLLNMKREVTGISKIPFISKSMIASLDTY